ncbi:MAG: alpha-L-fucosidase [Bacteroidetes bacterium]|nr:alpha-L-fucosidase [Bacteroidota bacterium]
MKPFKILAFLISLCSSSFAQKNNYAVIKPTDSEQDIIRIAANIVPTPRQLRWQQLELTAFFHFGMNTFTQREWGDGKEDPKLFNPTNLDAEQWVKTMKDAGFKQVIITAKHHDGFCLWPTATTLHSVKSSPWKNGNGDVVKEVSDACKKLKMGFGIYLSPWDRNAPSYGSEAYNDFFIQQLTELLTQYGKVDEVWFDGANGEGPNGKKQVYEFERWYDLIRKLQPQAVIAIMGPDVRWVGTESGVGRSTEWNVIPADNLNQAAIANNSQKGVEFKPNFDMQANDLGSREKIFKAKALVWYPAETDVSIRPGWFYHDTEDSKVKTPKTLNDLYFTSVGMNGVLLLNVPPNREGRLSDADVKNLLDWSKQRNKYFALNFLKNSTTKSKNGIGLNTMVDENYNTYFTTKGNDSTTTIEFMLKKPATFDILSLQENIQVGQRVEKFAAFYEDKGTWKKFTEGTTIGYKRLLRFDPITTGKIKIEISSSRLNPTLSEVGLYKNSF